MFTKKTLTATLLAVGGVLALLSTPSVSVQTGDAGGSEMGGGGFDACGAKQAYEASQTLEEAANEQYGQINEPQWNLLSQNAGRPANPAQFLRDLRANLAKARQRNAKAGNPTPAQAEKNYQDARKRLDQTEDKYAAKLALNSRLQRDIQALIRDIQNLDTKLAALNSNAGRPANSDRNRRAEISKQEAIVTATQAKIENLVVFERGEPFDMDVARERVNNPGWREFNSPSITSAKGNLNNFDNAEQLNARERDLEVAINAARTEARNTFSQYTAASRALSKLRSDDDGSDNNSADVATGAELRKQKAAKQKQIENKTTQKAGLGLQKPTAEDVNAAVEKVRAAEANRELAKQEAELAKDLRLVEPWITARLVRNGTEKRRQDAAGNYARAVKIKDSALNQARSKFNELQNWLNGRKNALRGRQKDAEYWQAVSEMKTRGGSAYAAMEVNLADLACFPDVNNFLDDIRARRATLAAIQIGKPVTPAIGTGTGTGGGNLSGNWTTDWGAMTLSQSGSSFSGTYTHDGGKVKGTISGNKATGTWSESPTYKAPNDAGTFEWTLSSDRRSFSGKWRYGSGSWDNRRWTGSRR